jgi:hypothetical protein
MSRSGRREKTEAQLHTLEGQFSADLVAALRDCAAGKWGMFGQNDAVIERQSSPLREMLQSDIAARLIAAGEEIEELRRRIGMVEPFLLFKRYLEYRQMQSANSPGEPKLAAQFLAELKKPTVVGEE